MSCEAYKYLRTTGICYQNSPSPPAPPPIGVGGRDQLMAQLKILVDAQLPNIVPAAAAAGDVDVLCNHLDTHPQDVYITCMPHACHMHDMHVCTLMTFLCS